METKKKNKPRPNKSGRRGRRHRGLSSGIQGGFSAQAQGHPIAPRSTLNSLSDEITAAVVYEKTTKMDVGFKLADIFVKEAATKPCADLYFKLPGMNLDNNPADVCHIHHAEVGLENHSDYRVYIRMQKPMGFKSDPAALAMWEPYGEDNSALRIVEPGKRTTYRMHYGVTTFMGPHQTFLGGQECLHLCTFAFTRDAIDKHGSAPALTSEMKKAIVVRGSVEVKYRSASARVGQETDIGIRLYGTTDRMDNVDPGPVSTISLQDGYGKKGEFILFKRTANGKTFMIAKNEKVEDPIFNRLDQSTTYRLPTVIIGNGSAITKLGDTGDDVKGVTLTNVAADVIKYDASDVDNPRWRLGKLVMVDGADGGVFTNIDMPVGYSPIMSMSEMLMPVDYGKFKFSVKVTGSGKAVRGLVSKKNNIRGQLTADGVIFKWFPSYTTILRVVKEAVLFAIATGVLENVIDEDDFTIAAALGDEALDGNVHA